MGADHLFNGCLPESAQGTPPLTLRQSAMHRLAPRPAADNDNRTSQRTARHARALVSCATQLRRCFRAHNYQRACGRASWTSGRSLVDKGHSTPARTAVCDDQNLVLVTLASARCSLAVEPHDPQRAFTGCGCCARRSGRTLCALRPWRSRWARRTGFAFFPRRPGRAGLPLRPLSAARYANGKCNCNHDTFHMHAHTLTSVASYPTLFAN
jgi:hypothetical protein